MIGLRFVAPSPRSNSNKRKSSEIQDGNGGNDDGEDDGDDVGDNGDGDNDEPSATSTKVKRPPLKGFARRFYRVSLKFINRTFHNYNSHHHFNLFHFIYVAKIAQWKVSYLPAEGTSNT
jgi:hypothetical protein